TSREARWEFAPGSPWNTIFLAAVMAFRYARRPSESTSRSRHFDRGLVKPVIAGLDRAIHLLREKFLRRMMDPRVKPVGDRGLRRPPRLFVPIRMTVA